MKGNYKFYLGLSFGLLIGFLMFNFNPANSANTDVSKQMNTSSTDPTIAGSWEDLDNMQDKINAYKSDFIEQYNLPENTSTGGFIKRTVLNDLTGTMDGAYLKYSFYYDGEGKIGLYFQKKSNQDAGIRTGSGAFCPSICNYPD